MLGAELFFGFEKTTYVHETQLGIAIQKKILELIQTDFSWRPWRHHQHYRSLPTVTIFAIAALVDHEELPKLSHLQQTLAVECATASDSTPISVIEILQTMTHLNAINRGELAAHAENLVAIESRLHSTNRVSAKK